MARKIIIDMDPGIDAAIALTMALFEPRFDVVAVTATGGRVSPAQATQNVQMLIEQLDPPRWPRIGAANPDQLLPLDALNLHGQDGLGNTNFPVAGLAKLQPAEKVLGDEIRAAPEDVTVVALGPLTNIARAMNVDSNLHNQIGRLLICGGTITAPGDITPAAEYSMFSDPLSARLVLRSKTTKTMLPLDASRQLTFSFDLLDHLPNETTRSGRLLRGILPYAFRAQRNILGREQIELNSLIAIVSLTNPELFEMQNMAVDVETEGVLTTGATVFDRRSRREWRPNVEVITSIDANAVRDCIIRSLKAIGC
jgi:inosine-uridine nucleoside N-ribohydrolase